MKESNLILYSLPEGFVKVEVIFEEESFWLNQKRMADLFQVDVRTINEHLKNIFESSELQQVLTIRKFRIVQTEGKRIVDREIEFYHLDAIIAVGYRVNSYQATRFRIWATQTLKEYIVKGFVMDDNRLKQGNNFGKDYFDELLERIREIRASERRFYQKITDIYALSSDYDRNAPQTNEFFASVQNKLHWAINFLNLSNYPILQHLGQISAMEAKIKAETEFDKYRVIQDQNYVSDFDNLMNQLNKGGSG
jgi:hypothetical protein